MLLRMLGWLIITVASAKATFSDDGHLPVYLFNTQPLYSVGKLLPAEIVPALTSHFLGDAAAALDVESEAIVSQLESRFMDERGSAVLVVENLDQNQAEARLGSPHFYVDRRSSELLKSRSTPVNFSELKHMLQSGDTLLHIDASGLGTNWNSRILTVLKEVENMNRPATKMMVIGIPGDAKVYNVRSEARDSFSEQNNSIPYDKIPDFFNSLNACMSGTNNCSQKGTCVETMPGKFSCKCTSTKVGNYTYYWGGSDCSKRDVSFQFSLIVGTTVAILAATALSVMLLFKLGSQPLPGVLNISSL